MHASKVKQKKGQAFQRKKEKKKEIEVRPLP